LRALTASLRMVVPPLSNQEADRVKKSQDPVITRVRRRMGDASIYMIAQRQEIFIADKRWDEERGHLYFTLVLGEKRLEGAVDAASLSKRFGKPSSASMGIFANDKHIHVLDVDEHDNRDPVWGASADALLFHAWRRDPDVELRGDIRAFATYRLLYIGMSEDGAYQRLINAPHHARLDILTNEYQIRAEARVSDEIYFFLFDVEPLHLQSWGPDDDITDEQIARMMGPDAGLPQANLVCDVEKAFISMLDTPYNKRKYKSYPQVAGGLAGLDIDSYAYAIAEDLSFEVMGQRVDGGYSPDLPNSNEADFILVKDGEVSLIDVSENLEVDF
jgi:hypothetical protein